MAENYNKKKQPVFITQFKWAGKLGPFRITTSCSECDLTTAVIEETIKNEFKDKNVIFEVKPWLDNFFYCLLKGTWHAPIIMVNGKKFYQYSKKQPLFDQDKLVVLVNKYLEA